jgi:hypothetical protein
MDSERLVPSTRAPILVIQLNHAQWHVLIPGRFASGVTNYVSAIANGLAWGLLDQRRVETVDLCGTRLLMARGGAAWVQ